MIYVGIDVAKDKHDCHIFDSDGVVWHDNFSFANSKDGFLELLATVAECVEKTNYEVKIGLEDTGHYSSNLLAYLQTNGFNVVRFNPLSVNRSRIAGTLRKTKTDKGDARFIAALLVAGTNKASKPTKTIPSPRLNRLQEPDTALSKRFSRSKTVTGGYFNSLFPKSKAFSLKPTFRPRSTCSPFCQALMPSPIAISVN